MNIGLQNPLESVVNNLRLTVPQESVSTAAQSSDDLFSSFRPLPSLPYPSSPQAQFNQMFGNVLQLFKTFVGTMRDLGLIKMPQAESAEGAEAAGTEAAAEPEDKNPLSSILESIIGPVTSLFGGIGGTITGLLGKLTKPGALLNSVKNVFKKAKKVFTDKDGILSGAFKLIKSFF